MAAQKQELPDNNDAVLQFVFRKDFFKTLAVNEHSQEVMKKLNKKYEVFIVSSAMEFPNFLKNWNG